jgi:hypothetical protein
MARANLTLAKGESSTAVHPNTPHVDAGQRSGRPREPGNEFTAFWRRDSRVIAAIQANIWDQGEALEALILSEAQVDKARLTDPDQEFASLTAPRYRPVIGASWEIGRGTPPHRDETAEPPAWSAVPAVVGTGKIDERRWIAL